MLCLVTFYWCKVWSIYQDFICIIWGNPYVLIQVHRCISEYVYFSSLLIFNWQMCKWNMNNPLTNTSLTFIFCECILFFKWLFFVVSRWNFWSLMYLYFSWYRVFIIISTKYWGIEQRPMHLYVRRMELVMDQSGCSHHFWSLLYRGNFLFCWILSFHVSFW